MTTWWGQGSGTIRESPSPGHQAPPWERGQAGEQAAGRGDGEQSCCSITGAGADSPGRLKWGPGPWARWGGTGEALETATPVSALRAPRPASPPRSVLETCVSGLVPASQVPPWEQHRLPAGAHSPAGGWWQHEGRVQLWHPADVLPRGQADVPTAAHSRNNHDFGVSCGVTHCKLCTWYPRNQDYCYSLFLIPGCCPFPTRCARSPCWQMHSTGLLSVCRFGYSWGT